MSDLFQLEGGMTLYVKAGPDGTSLGDCPFAHFVRMVLEAKKLEYELLPTTGETKPQWLMEHYEGKMPALRHRKECYVESETIAAYLDFFFPEPPLSDDSAYLYEGLFPAMAQYLKHTPDGDATDVEKQNNLRSKLQILEDHLASSTSGEGPFLTGSQSLRMSDCQLAPILYHMLTVVPLLKRGVIDFSSDYPAVQAYSDAVFATSEFQKTSYPVSTMEWGWRNARMN